MVSNSNQEKDGTEMKARNLICIVDDDASMSRMLTRMISSLKFEVAAFTSAEELLESGRIREASCLILDVNLPGMSGIELQQRLNSDPERVPIIFISGGSDEPIRESAMAKGAAAFFKKPFRIDSLLGAIQSFTTWERWSLTGASQ
jgi:FixJ family two-component response regulator